MAGKIWRASETYEYSDFNRVESITRAAYEQFKNSMSLHDKIITVIDRTIYSIFVVDDINRIEKNLKYLDFTGSFDQRKWVEGAGFSLDDANRWERAVDILEKAIVGVQSIRCGTHRCGTWPKYSVIGLVVNGSYDASMEVNSGTYEVPIAGTQPQYSVIGTILTQESIMEASGATAAFEVDICGTMPGPSQIGAAISMAMSAYADGGSAIYDVSQAGMDECGTLPEKSLIGEIIQEEIDMSAPENTKPYKVAPAGVKYCGEEV